MLAEDAAEEQEKGQSVNEPAGADVPSAFPKNEGEDAAPYPNQKEYIGSDVPVEIKEAPGQEEQWKCVGGQMLETAVYKRMGKDAEKSSFFHRIDPQSCEIPIHSYF